MAKFREKLEVSSEIPGKFGTFGIITVSIRSIAATSPGFPTGAPTFWTGVPFYVIIYSIFYLRIKKIYKFGFQKYLEI